jgi:hypothetical protein
VRTAETLARNAKDKLDQARDARNAGDLAGAKDLVNNAATSLRDAAGRMEEFHVQTNNNPAAQAMANHGSTISNANRTYNQANALANKAAGTEVLAEVRKFKKWLNRKPNKPFNFEYLDETYASTLNKFIAVGDHDGARWYVNEYL